MYSKLVTMSVKSQIKEYMDSLPASKQADMQELHRRVLELMPDCKLWFLDGRNEEGKVVTNPNIGYGELKMKLAGGKTRDFYQIGLSANTTGISVYIMGIEDRKYLPKMYEKKIGKASVTGYCIKFKSVKDIHLPVLEEAIKFGVQNSNH